MKWNKIQFVDMATVRLSAQEGKKVNKRVHSGTGVLKEAWVRPKCNKYSNFDQLYTQNVKYTVYQSFLQRAILWIIICVNPPKSSYFMA